ncbi:MAG: aldolase, partial [Candidatus Brocadiales bacterium]|nr:aldolase [Candidatus Brocadiales bacterium]
EFQNMIYENSLFPQDFKNEIYEFLNKNYAADRKEGETDEQFIYKTRKNGFGPFKERFWNLPADVKNKIGEELEVKFDFLFKKLNVIHSKEIIKKTIKPVEVQLPHPPDFP